MKREELIISDLGGAVLEKNSLAPYACKDRWEVVPYESAAASGSFLIASENTMPEPVTINMSLKGWYRIYVCLLETGSAKHIDLALTGDLFSRTICPGNVQSHIQWQREEVAEESFWRCADMTGRNVIVSKPDAGIPYTSNLVWLRFVPMTENDVEAYKKACSEKTMLAHMDGDFHMHDGAKEPRDYCKMLYAMRDSKVGVVCQEITNELLSYEIPNGYVGRNKFENVRLEYMKRLSDNRAEVYRKEIEFAHSQGMQMFAAQRMQLSNFAFPYEGPVFKIPFVDEHPELRCESRDGVPSEFLSYAYPQTGDFMIQSLLDAADHGFDGVMLIFIRGEHLLYEEPVRNKFRELYGDEVDCRRLPVSDPRLQRVRCDIMTEFMRRLRQKLNEYATENGKAPLKLYLSSYFTVESAMEEGFDIERLARENLIDGVIQSKKLRREDIDDVLADDGLIDLDAYAEKARREHVYFEIHGSDVPLLVKGVPEYARIADTCGIELYTEVQWEGKQAHEYVNAAKQIFAAGGHKIALWDAPVRVQKPSEWCGTAMIGDAETVAKMPDDEMSYRRIWKILSYKGRDMRYINPSWRG